MKYKELEKMLKRSGCYFVDHGKKHDTWFSPKTGKYFQMPRHGREDVKSGTLHEILKVAGIK